MQKVLHKEREDKRKLAFAVMKECCKWWSDEIIKDSNMASVEYDGVVQHHGVFYGIAFSTFHDLAAVAIIIHRKYSSYRWHSCHYGIKFDWSLQTKF